MPDQKIARAAHQTRSRLLLSTALIIVSGTASVMAAVRPSPEAASPAIWAAPGASNVIEYAAANGVQNAAHYSDGEFIGKTASTIWGEVQVKAIIRGGAVTDVLILQYPSHRRRSAMISNWALPILRSEAIRAQSAQVDVVSQASITAEGFQLSLASALKQATK